jgi:hypothetical protein
VERAAWVRVPFVEAARGFEQGVLHDVAGLEAITQRAIESQLDHAPQSGLERLEHR